MMAVCIMGNGRKGKKRAMVFSITEMEIFTRASGQTAKGTVTVFSISKTEVSSRVNGPMTR